MLLAGIPVTVGIMLAPQTVRGQSKRLIDLDKRVGALRVTGKYADAIPLAEQLVRQAEPELGKNHVLTAIALYSLADLYMERGLYSDAEPIFKRSLVFRH
jgi:lipopolysaccharide biosynthesis regulator YciM